MIVTKNCAELCVLLINELYGQLPSRIFAALVAKGRLNTPQLARIAAIQPRTIRTGLYVLIQQNLVYHCTDSATGITNYEANVPAAYNLARHGKILDMIHHNYGEEAMKLISNILNSGHVRISDLVKKYQSNHAKPIKEEEHDPVFGNGNLNGLSSEMSATIENQPDAADHALDTIAHLIAVGILEPVSSRMFQSPDDVRTEIEQELMTAYPSGLRGAKQKSDFFNKFAEEMKGYQEESKMLKRQLEPQYIFGSAAKRRKLANGTSNGFMVANHDNLLTTQQDVVVRVNYDKCLVELRNRKLAQFVDDEIGEVTAHIYSAMLSVLCKKINSCQIKEDDAEPAAAPSVSTLEIFDNLRSSVDVFAGMGKASPDKINVRSAEKVQTMPPGYEDTAEVSSDEEEDDDIVMTNGIGSNGVHDEDTKITTTGHRESKVKFEEKVYTKADRIQQTRQHLLVLAESDRQYVRHCGIRDQGEWTVDFGLLLQKLKFADLDTLIEANFGRPGLRLTRILREKGKLDDKTLPALALMKKADVHLKMVEMELAGYLDVQEVPRDNNRTANRSLFLWFFDAERTLARVLDNTYKAMVRHLQRLDVERRRKSNVLSVAERKDVQGMEQDKLRADVYNEYREFLDTQEKLLGQVSRLDELVAVFRDY